MRTNLSRMIMATAVALTACGAPQQSLSEPKPDAEDPLDEDRLLDKVRSLSETVDALKSEIRQMAGLEEFCIVYSVTENKAHKRVDFEGNVCFSALKRCEANRKDLIKIAADIRGVSTEDASMLSVSQCELYRVEPWCFEFINSGRGESFEKLCTLEYTTCQRSIQGMCKSPISACGRGRDDTARRQKSRGFLCLENGRGALGAACGLSKVHCMQLMQDERAVKVNGKWFEPGRCTPLPEGQKPWCGTGTDKTGTCDLPVVICADSKNACNARLKKQFGEDHTPCVEELPSLFLGSNEEALDETEEAWAVAQ